MKSQSDILAKLGIAALNQMQQEARKAILHGPEVVLLSPTGTGKTLAFLLPIILIIFFGYAISYDVTNIRMAVLDRSQTQESRAFVEAFESSGYFRVTEHLSSYADVDTRLGRGTARLALVIPPNFSRDLNSRRPAPVQLILDGGDANTATIAKLFGFCLR